MVTRTTLRATGWDLGGRYTLGGLPSRSAVTVTSGVQTHLFPKIRIMPLSSLYIEIIPIIKQICVILPEEPKFYKHPYPAETVNSDTTVTMSYCAE